MPHLPPDEQTWRKRKSFFRAMNILAIMVIILYLPVILLNLLAIVPVVFLLLFLWANSWQYEVVRDNERMPIWMYWVYMVCTLLGGIASTSFAWLVSQLDFGLDGPEPISTAMPLLLLPVFITIYTMYQAYKWDRSD